jgi:3-dehydroquinate synthase
MIVASRISNRLGLISNEDIERQRILLEELGFILKPPKLDPKKIVEIMHSDKKTVGESIRFVLPTGIGRTPILRPVSSSLITQSLEDEGYG